ncbi:hypothetical protein FHX42_002396 [Saccharopolyspora lacisalsi]|uniref:Carboxypeptidase regulatory-like domain-containing protein n=1 Tax=Halosaccharopolyspora lacisalsi TaxID=1000566 RepID=A0A839E045_9PSEU|nr:carboxypeptidase regulatory-like domain-containing protein [Halosaccharopolyspora lacisalsi]MBA8825045.1 hypothetical protein [Halosaccharopolyspora lacisalsi]
MSEESQTAEARQEPAAPEKSSLVKTLVSSLWFPVFFVVGFMVFYLVPFHAPAPTNVPVAVVGDQAATSLETGFQRSAPGSFDVTAVPSEQAGRQAIMERDVVATYSPADGELFVASANGRALTQVLSASFEPIAEQGGGELSTTDVAPTAPGDVMGTGLFYLLMAMNIGGYITVMMLLRAALSKRTKLFTLVGMGVFSTLFCYLVGTGLQVIDPDLWVLPIGFLLTQAVAWTAFGLVPFVKQFIPGVAMGLFVLLSIPSSGGAIPKEMVPSFFQSLHSIMPLGQAVDAMRGVLYFRGNEVLWPVVGLLIWCAVGAALIVFDAWRNRRKQAARQDSTESTERASEAAAEEPDTHAHPLPMLTGTVSGRDGSAIEAAVITIADSTGNQLARVHTSPEGEYAVESLPEQYVTVVAASRGCRPTVERVSVHAGKCAQQNFVLHGVPGEHERDPENGTLVSGAGAVPPA